MSVTKADRLHLREMRGTYLKRFSGQGGAERVRASSPLAQGNPAAAAYAPRELDDHSFGPEDTASMSAAFEAALGQLGFDREERSLGVFQDQRSAADAISSEVAR